MGNPEGYYFRRVFARDNRPFELDTAFRRLNQARRRVEEGRLPGSIGADKGHYLTRSNLYGDASERLETAVEDIDGIDSQQRPFAHRRASTSSSDPK